MPARADDMTESTHAADCLVPVPGARNLVGGALPPLPVRARDARPVYLYPVRVPRGHPRRSDRDRVASARSGPGPDSNTQGGRAGLRMGSADSAGQPGVVEPALARRLVAA